MCFNQFTNVQSFLCSFVVLPHLYRIGDWTLSCRLNSLSGCCFAFPEKRPCIMPNLLSTIVWLWNYGPSLQKGQECSALTLPCMIVQEHGSSPFAPVRGTKSNRPNAHWWTHPATRITWSMHAFLTMWTVSNTANNRTGRRPRSNAFYLWRHQSSCKAVYYKLQS